MSRDDRPARMKTSRSPGLMSSPYKPPRPDKLCNLCMNKHIDNTYIDAGRGLECNGHILQVKHNKP